MGDCIPCGAKRRRAAVTSGDAAVIAAGEAGSTPILYRVTYPGGTSEMFSDYEQARRAKRAGHGVIAEVR